MSESTIEWTDATWNPVAGCSVLSAGCTNCYAMQMARRLEAMGMAKYHGLTRRSGSKTVWKGTIREDHKSLDIPLRWRKPRKVFVNSMSDLFHPEVSTEFIKKVWSVMESTPHHNYQILTKRPGRMAKMLLSLLPTLPNVWLGTSVEDSRVIHRIDELRNVPAAVRFISFEPLIGPVGQIDLSGIQWAIVGGESGPSARRMKAKWVDDIKELCDLHKTAFFFKQWGAWGEDNKRRSKKENGRIYLDQTWNDMPTVNQV